MDPNQGQPGGGSGVPQSSQAQQGSMAIMDANKKAALAGQWRTPPVPVFPGVPPMLPQQQQQPTQQQQQQPQQQQQAKSETVDLSQLPDSTEDYAKALQEAYRRGAEAAQAQAMAQQQSTLLPSTSCPDFQQEKILPTPTNAGTATSSPVLSQPAQPFEGSNMKNPPPQPTAVASAATVPDPLSMPPPTTSPMTVINSPAAPPANITTAGVAGVVPMPLHTPMLPQPNAANSAHVQPTHVQPTHTHHALHPPPMVHHPGVPMKPSTAAGATLVPPHPPTQRSMSLPDMSTYAAQQEEEKRQKRLARNRASARLRRLRKKNLVEAYEQEVGILEKTLSQLQAHEWGKTDNVAALTEALSMDRGQQVLTFEQRHEAAASLLDQQLQWIEMLEEIMMEDYVLQNVRNGEFAELREIMDLDDEQLDQIEESKAGWEEEWQALQTLKTSLNSMRENDWLWNESVSAIAEQFMGILHKNQVSKFLLWADHNAEAIDELDGVNAYSGTPNGPVFAFGVESQPGENFGEEEK